jgi:hypothetical protein
VLGSLECSAKFIGILYMITGTAWITSTLSMGKTIDSSSNETSLDTNKNENKN